MNHFEQIQAKLRAFYRKYYKNLLIKGTLLFLTFGLLYFLATTLLEYSLWLSPISRTILFWTFILVESYLFLRFVGKPIIKLIQATKGISNKDLSKIIGKHFKEVEDKLLNVLQLKESEKESDLLLASIEQKSKELIPIPFNKAINYRWNLTYVKYVSIPVVLIIILFFTNLVAGFSSGFKRVVDYKTAYEPPAPFAFNLLNKNLNVVQGEDFTIKAITTGKVIPSEAKIFFNNQEYYLNKNNQGFFDFTFSQIQENTTFYIEANKVKSENFSIEVLKTPRINGVSLNLEYPKYTKKENATITSSPNLIVPEGTKINWEISTQNTDNIHFIVGKDRTLLNQKEEDFVYSKVAKKSFNYQITSSNQKIKEYEKLSFFVSVLKDEFPKIQVQSNIDSIQDQLPFFVGQISDDYGIRKLQLVYEESGNPESKKNK